MMSYLVTFVCMFLLDFCWAYYTRKVTEGRAMAASTWATILIILNATVMKYMTTDWAYFIPAAFGAFIGTYIAIKIEKAN